MVCYLQVMLCPTFCTASCLIFQSNFHPTIFQLARVVRFYISRLRHSDSAMLYVNNTVSWHSQSDLESASPQPAKKRLASRISVLWLDEHSRKLENDMRCQNVKCVETGCLKIVFIYFSCIVYFHLRGCDTFARYIQSFIFYHCLWVVEVGEDCQVKSVEKLRGAA